MLGLLSFALVLAATVLLVLGLLDDDGLSLIYASMVCSATAAVVLIVARRHLNPIAEVEVAPAATPVAASPLDFPIADYDDLTAGQILPLLPQLYTDEIGIVEARERATKARPEILDRLGKLRPAPPPADDAPEPARPSAVEPPP